MANFLTHAETGFCDLELDVFTIHGNYTWKETAAGENYSSVCQFGPEDDVIEAMAMVTRMCAGPHNWLDYYGGYCITEVTWKIRQLANVSYIHREYSTWNHIQWYTDTMRVKSLLKNMLKHRL